MGHLLRAEAARETDQGRKVRDIINHGDLVPTQLTMDLISDELARHPATQHIIFDGFPRSIDQAEALAKVIEVTKAVHIDLPYDVSVKRISGRLLCDHGHYYNSYYVPPEREGICNVDHTPLHRRDDDTEEAVKHRLELYGQVTTKVLEYYRSQGKLITVNGDASVFQVSHEIKEKVLNDIL
jgi:adenylate kinase